MRVLSNFFLGAILSVGLIVLTAAVTSFLSNHNQLVTSASAVDCSNASSGVGCNVGCVVVGGKNMKCHTAGLDSAGTCACPGTFDCVSDPSCPQAAATTTPTSATNNADVVSKLSNVTNFFTDGLGDLISNIVKKIMETFLTILGGKQQAYAPGHTPKNIADAYENYGAVGALGLSIQDMYQNPPIHTSDYLASLHILPQAYATNTPSGREVLEGVGGNVAPTGFFWKATRNLAYIFFVLILMAVGLMILFRSKIDPRTTVSVTAAIPNLIVAMVLITFSLAIAGLLIDAGKLLEEVVKNIINGAVTNNQPLVHPGPNGNQVGLSVGDIWGNFLLNNNNPVSFGDGPITGIVSTFINLVVLAFAFFVGIQVFLMLLFRYINLIVKPVFAPFVFLVGALPGKGDTTWGWFKSYLVDVLTFPIVLFILNLASAIKQSGVIGKEGDAFGIFAHNANLTSIVAIGVLIFATKVPAFLEEAFDTKPSSHVDKSGSQPGSMAKQIPILKNFL